MSWVLYLVIGIAAGAAGAWLFLRGRASASEAVTSELRRQGAEKDTELTSLRSELSSERQFRVAAETRYAEAEKKLAEQLALFETMKKELSETFKSLSLDALSRNSDEFLKLADETLKARSVESKKELEGKKELIDQSLLTISKTLGEVRTKIEEVGRGSMEKFGEVSTLVKSHAEITSRLTDTTAHLKQALASSKKRGEWGERMAEDVIRLAGMVEGINYIKQRTLEGSSGRPDYTFLLPNNLKINMDVKFPMENYQHYLGAESEHDKKRYRDELLKGARLMLRDLTKNREYINPAANTVDYVIVFIPNEQVYGFINESSPGFMDEALQQKVVLCSPFTLYAVLAVIRQAVENFNLEKTASEILKLLAEFSKQWNAYKEKFRLMGERLDAAKKEYDVLLSTRSNMLERPLRKIEELRRQEDIALDETLKLEETTPPDNPARQLE